MSPLYKIFFVLNLLSIHFCFAQKEVQVYENYTTLNGLVSNKIYAAAQDKQGFIWFGTDYGVSRFDGKMFKNFTTEDGLPDNEIIRIFCDSKGRVWLIPFKQNICYFYKGKIYNHKNDSLLKKITIVGTCYNIIENKKGNIIIHDTKGLHIIEANNEITNLINANYNIVNINTSAIYDCIALDLTSHSILKLENNILSKYKEIKNETIQNNDYLSDNISINNYYNNYSKRGILFYNLLNNYSQIIPTSFANTFEKKDSIYYAATNKGVDCFTFDGNIAIKKGSIFEGIAVNRVFFDNENNIYFLTNGKGVYKKRIAATHNYTFQQDDLMHRITYINGNSKNILIGTNNSIAYSFNKTTLETSKLYNKLTLTSSINFIKELTQNNILLSLPSGLININKKVNTEEGLIKGIKYVEEIEKEYLAGSFVELVSISKQNLLIIDTIWKSRTTCANKLNNDYYIGAISGLYKKNIVSGVIDTLSKQNEIFNNRVSFIKVDPSNVVWVGFANKGLVAFKDNKILVHLTKKYGLPSDFLKTAFIQNEMLWVGTNSGIAKINTASNPLKVAVTYSKNIGLLSDDVNSIYVDSNTVYLGTDEGLSYFKEQDIQQNSTCNLQITGITVSNQQLFYDSSFLYLNRKDNNIKIDFVAISHSSEGEINYYYRLIGLKEEWSETKDNYISYPTLDPSKYSFEIYAINKFGKKSEVVTIPFEIKKMFYETNWFKFLMLLASLLLIAFYINRRISKIKKRAKEKEQYTKQIYELEQKALKSQMNPHFIFNSLNSIQEYVMNSDVEGANTFISNFSKLIRATLDNSDKREISLEQELDYIKTYLALEQHRFENKFSFEIILNNDVIPSEIYLPAMLFQPFLENSIRHGINNKTEGIGKILIKIRKDSKNLICEILDNGIGIEAAQKLGKRNSIEYQSKGMKLTSKRIELLNKSFNQHIEVKVENNNESTTGTKITLIIPIA